MTGTVGGLKLKLVSTRLATNSHIRYKITGQAEAAFLERGKTVDRAGKTPACCVAADEHSATSHESLAQAPW